MPTRDELPISIRFTDEQKEWLRAESVRLQRPIGWIVRSLIIAEMNRRPLGPREVAAAAVTDRVA